MPIPYRASEAGQTAPLSGLRVARLHTSVCPYPSTNLHCLPKATRKNFNTSGAIGALPLERNLSLPPNASLTLRKTSMSYGLYGLGSDGSALSSFSRAPLKALRERAPLRPGPSRVAAYQDVQESELSSVNKKTMTDLDNLVESVQDTWYGNHGL